MTNTLHRRGSPEALKRDFVVFAMRKRDDEGFARKMGKFSEICLSHGPVNMGRMEDGSLRHTNILHIEEDMKGKIGVTATFDNIEAVASVVLDLKKADLGVSVNVSGLLEEVKECCKKAGIQRHSAESSLGVFGKTGRLPPREILEMGSMCGHGLVSFNLIKKVVDEVKMGRMNLEQGAFHLAKPCECGVFNPTRAKRLLESLRLMS